MFTDDYRERPLEPEEYRAQEERCQNDTCERFFRPDLSTATLNTRFCSVECEEEDREAE